MTATAEAVAVPQSVQSTLSAAGLFEGFARDGFRLRDPAPSINGLPRFRAAGDCVEPLLTAGDGLFIDHSAQPQHGDLVLFEWPQAVIDRWHGSERKAEWVRQFGHADFSRGVKLLWRWPQGIPEQFQADYLCARDGIRAVDGHKVLGVVRAVERGGVILPPEADLARRVVPMSSLDFAAATDVAGYVLSAANTVFPSIVSGYTQWGVAGGPVISYDATVIVTSTLVVCQNNGAYGDVSFLVWFFDGASFSWPTVTFATTPSPLPMTDPQTITVRFEFSHAASFTNTVQCGAAFYNSSGATRSVTAGSQTIQLEAIKR